MARKSRKTSRQRWRQSREWADLAEFLDGADECAAAAIMSCSGDGGGGPLVLGSGSHPEWSGFLVTGANPAARAAAAPVVAALARPEEGVIAWGGPGGLLVYRTRRGLDVRALPDACRAGRCA